MKWEWRKSLSAAVASVAVVAMSQWVQAGEAPAPKPAEPAQDWVDQAKAPTSWLKWGADERLRQEYIQNPFFFNTDPPGEDWNFGRYRTRLWATVTASDDVELSTRLSWEFRYWDKPGLRWDPDDNMQWNDVVFDHLNVKIKNIGGIMTATIGRQDIILGDGWLVLEGTPLDGSTTIYFDAARFTFDFKDAKTTLDAIYVNQYGDPDKWLPPIGSRSLHQIEQDERGVILYATNRSIERTEISPYFIYKHGTRQPFLSRGKSGSLNPGGDNEDTYTAGTRVTHAFDKNWRAKVEGAYQWGHRENPMFPDFLANNDVSAYGVNSELAYSFNDDWKNTLKFQFEHLSGDDRDSSTIEQFDPLWGRWPQWSEYYVYTYATETRIAEVTNFIRLGAGWQAQPTSKMTLAAAYHALWAHEDRDDATGFSDDLFRGHLITGIVRYKFNRHLSAHLLGEYLFTGNYYEEEGPRNDDNGAYVRAEVMLTF